MSTLREDIEALRSIPGRWKAYPDPLAELRKIRYGYDLQADPANDTPEERTQRNLELEQS
jgi:hypothetical protein